MPPIKLLPWNDFSVVEKLFHQSALTEGSPGWFHTLAKETLDPGEECVIAVSMDSDGAFRAALPLVRGVRGSLRGLTAPYTTIFAPAFPEDKWAYVLGECAPLIVKNSLRLDALNLGHPGTASFLAGLRKSKLAIETFFHFPNWCERIDAFDNYWAQRPSKLKSTVRRKLSALNANHRVSFQCANSGADLQVAAIEYENVYKSSWKVQEPHPQFISTLIRTVAEDNLIRIGTLSIDEKIVAAQLWLVKDDKATIFKLAHLQGFESYSPGTLLTHWLLAHLCKFANIRFVDFGRGDDLYKRDWFSMCERRDGIIAANWRSLNGMPYLVRNILPTRLSHFLHKAKK